MRCAKLTEVVCIVGSNLVERLSQRANAGLAVNEFEMAITCVVKVRVMNNRVSNGHIDVAR